MQRDGLVRTFVGKCCRPLPVRDRLLCLNTPSQHGCNGNTALFPRAGAEAVILDGTKRCTWEFLAEKALSSDAACQPGGLLETCSDGAVAGPAAGPTTEVFWVSMIVCGEGTNGAPPNALTAHIWHTARYENATQTFQIATICQQSAPKPH